MEGDELMKVEKYYCDKCKKEVEKDGFVNLLIGDPRNYGRKGIDLCDDCQEKVGIVKKEGTEIKKVESTAEQLYDIIAEIVYENQGE